MDRANQVAGDRLLRLEEVLARVGVRKSCWYQGIAEGRFPEPVRLSSRCSRWLQSEIDELIQRMAREREGGRP